MALDPSLQQIGPVGIVCAALGFVFKLYRDAMQKQVDDRDKQIAALKESCAKWEKLAWDSIQVQRQATQQLGQAAAITKEAVQIAVAEK